MVKIKMQMKEGKVQEFEAAKILEQVNFTENLVVLQGMKWGTTGKEDFLTGKTSAFNSIIAEPLSEEDAKQAVEEYFELMGYKKTN